MLFHELNRVELAEVAPKALLILPVGATEQHGPHLPTGTDFLIVEYLARTCAESLARALPVVVTPTLCFGSSPHHLPFGATISISSSTYYQVLSEIIDSLILSGFKKLFILNGHGGNDDLIKLVARDLALKHPVNIAAASYWTVAWKALVSQDAHTLGELPGHAGAFETSLILHLHQHLVAKDRPKHEPVSGSNPDSFYPPYRQELHGYWPKRGGYTDSPHNGSRAWGEELLDTIIAEIAKAFTDFFEQPV